MTDSFTWVKDNPAVIASMIALCGVLISAFVAFVSGRRSVYISSVTVERSKWIDKLRSNIAELLELCAAISHETQKAGIAYSEKRNRADRLISLITLQLNPADKGGIDLKLISHLQILVYTSEKSVEKYRLEEKIFIRHSQFMLKEEWEKVKAEARGWLSSLWNKVLLNKFRRRRAYNKFCRDQLWWYFGRPLKKSETADDDADQG